MAKTKKSLPANLNVAFKNQSGEHTGTILEDRGLFWKVLDDTGEEYQVKKTSCTEIEPPAAPVGTLSASLAGLLNPGNPMEAGPKPAAPKEKDPNLVTLAELCTEYGIVGRIARRRLRSSFGQVGTGSRWEWKKDSADLAKVRGVLAPKPAPATPADPVASALNTLGMTPEDFAAATASAGEQGAAAAAASEE